jgi:hypothetical protein
MSFTRPEIDSVLVLFVSQDNKVFRTQLTEVLLLSRHCHLFLVIYDSQSLSVGKAIFLP